MKTTSSNLIRWAGLSAVLGGLIFAARIHPPDTLAAVTTTEWTIVHGVGFAMCLLIILGVAGIYATQMNETGWLGLAGFLLLEVMWSLTAAFQFVEALVLPLLVTDAPRFVEGFVGIGSGATGDANVGALPTVFSIASVFYLIGGVLLGTATFRTCILPRWAGAALAIGTVAPIAFSLLPHEFIRVAAVPFGLALAWLGYAVWSGRSASAPRAAPARSIGQLSQAAVE